MKRKGHIEIYESNDTNRKQRWRWRAVASNGKTTCDSGEGYVTRSKCRRAVKALQKTFGCLQII